MGGGRCTYGEECNGEEREGRMEAAQGNRVVAAKRRDERASHRAGVRAHTRYSYLESGRRV